MAATGSIRIVKTIPFKGGTKDWSNRFHFDGTLPPDDATWEILADNIVDIEKNLIPSNSTIIKAIGYGPTTDVPVFQKDYTTAGLTSFSGLYPQAPEVVALWKWTTAKRSTKNHPVYLFNYWHDVACDPAVALDGLNTTFKSSYEAYGADWIAGITDGTHDHHRTGPDGTLALAMSCEAYVTHRDFPR
jgi:hypothetical protein